MKFEEYRKHDAISLAGLIAKRQVSAKEVLETAIARAEQVNPAINAIVHKQYERARSTVAAEPPGGRRRPFARWPSDWGFALSSTSDALTTNEKPGQTGRANRSKD